MRVAGSAVGQGIASGNAALGALEETHGGLRRSIVLEKALTFHWPLGTHRQRSLISAEQKEEDPCRGPQSCHFIVLTLV